MWHVLQSWFTRSKCFLCVKVTSPYADAIRIVSGGLFGSPGTTGACATGAVTGVASAGFAGSAAFWQPTRHIITNSMKG